MFSNVVRRVRRWLAWTLVIVTAALVLGVGAGTVYWAGADIDTAGEVDFTRELAIPPLADSYVDEAGRRVFDLTMAAGQADFTGDGPADTWGINGDYLGPTLRARRGEQVQVNVGNELGETTTLHWHGMHLPAGADGGPHQPIEPGRTWSPSWSIDQPAATLWYHPHPHGETADHIYRGLAGMFILDDPQAAALPLPDEYGADDVPVIVQDKSFTADGRFDDGQRPFSPTGIVGDTVLVNGTAGAYHEVGTQRVRLRLLNASNARSYNFGFDDDRAFEQIGTDGGLLAVPHRTDRLALSPGERAEIVVSMTPGEEAVLRSYPAALGTDPVTGRFAGGDDTLDVLELRAGETLWPSPPVPDTLVDVGRLEAADAHTTRTFRLEGFSMINGRSMDMGRIDETVAVGRTEIWEVTNGSGEPHNFHVHDVQFQVLDVGGEPPPPALSGWKDTVYVEPGTTVRLIMRFSDYTDPDLPYMFHCHLLLHEDLGMMGQFVVVEPGQQAGRPPTAGHEHPGQVR